MDNTQAFVGGPGRQASHVMHGAHSSSHAITSASQRDDSNYADLPHAGGPALSDPVAYAVMGHAQPFVGGAKRPPSHAGAVGGPHKAHGGPLAIPSANRPDHDEYVEMSRRGVFARFDDDYSDARTVYMISQAMHVASKNEVENT